MKQQELDLFSSELAEIKSCVLTCEKCYNITREKLCHICQNPLRIQQNKLCVVSEPKDVWILEKTGVFQGLYHVLGGLISPIDGIHPEALRIKELLSRLKQESYDEILLAINPTVEGDTTMLFIKDALADQNIKLTKLAYGLPMGADMEYADQLTLQKSLQGRVDL